MDPTDSFIKNQQKFSLGVLTTAHARLSVLQLQKGFITQEDTQQSLRSMGQQNPADVNAHAGVLFEGIISAQISAMGQVKLTVKNEVIGNDEAFINAILEVIATKCNGVEYPQVEEFKKECATYLRQLKGEDVTEETSYAQNVYNNISSITATGSSGNFAHLLPSSSPSPSPSPAVSAMASPPFASPPPLPPLHTGPMGHMAHLPHTSHTVHASPGVSSAGSVEYDGPEEHKYAPARVEFERAEPIVRLLAQVRKVGMDILFPQSTHDKILATIFVAVRSFATPAHRELIDMVMTVKESNKVSQLEPVSKTKIRGVLALLKHGELLITQGEYGEPVRLSLAPGIDTFKDLRERHDVFLSMYMQDHHLFIPNALRTELVWQLDEDTRRMRLDAMDKLVLKLKHFFSGLSEYSAHAIDADSTGTSAGAVGVAGMISGTGSEVGYKPNYKNNSGAGGSFGGRGGGGGYAAQAGRGVAGGRYGAPYGGRGGRYNSAYAEPYYNNNPNHPNAGYGNGGQYGGGNNYAGGRYGSYQNRAQQQRLANAQASLTWLNNEEYQEIANEDWGEKSLSSNNSSSANSSTSTAASRVGGAASTAGRISNMEALMNAVNSGIYSSSNANSQLSPAAPSFDPSRLNSSTSAANMKATNNNNNSNVGNTLNSSLYNTAASNSSLTPKNSVGSLGVDMLGFDYSRLGSNMTSSLSSSRLSSLNGLNLIEPKDSANLDNMNLSLNSTLNNNDDAWLAAAAVGGRSNLDFWTENNNSSSFFDSVYSNSGLGDKGNSNLFLGDLSLNSRPYAAPGSGAGATGHFGGLSVDPHSPLDLDLSFEHRMNTAIRSVVDDSTGSGAEGAVGGGASGGGAVSGGGSVKLEE